MGANVHYWNHVQTDKCPGQKAQWEMMETLEQERVQSLFSSCRGQLK